jgi:hypothetical protein
MTEDEDLMALHEFRRELDEPRDGGLARGRYHLARTDEPVRHRRRWVLASAGAAAAVAVVVGAAAMATSQHTVVAGPRPTPPVTSAPPPDDELPVTQGTRAPVNPVVAGIGGATHAKAVAALDRLATAAAGAQPLQVDAGKVLYVKTYNLQDGEGRYIHELWLDPATDALLWIRRTDGATTGIDRRSPQTEIDQDAASPPGISHPTPAYYAGLPTDPTALLAAWRHWSQTQYPGRDADGILWKVLYDMFDNSEPFWTPQTRAAIYHAIGQMPAVKGTTATIDGKQYDAICMVRSSTGSDGAECQLFESASGRWVGYGDTGPDMVLKQGSFDFVDFGTQPRPPVGDPLPAAPTKGAPDPSHTRTTKPGG